MNYMLIPSPILANIFDFCHKPTLSRCQKLAKKIARIPGCRRYYSNLLEELGTYRRGLAVETTIHREQINEAFCLLKRAIQVELGLKPTFFKYPSFLKGCANFDWYGWSDGSVKSDLAGVGLYLKNKKDTVELRCFHRIEEVSAPLAELSALNALLRLAISLEISALSVSVDANFLIAWLNKMSEQGYKPAKLMELQDLVNKMPNLQVTKIPRILNSHADWLAGLSTTPSWKVEGKVDLSR